MGSKMAGRPSSYKTEFAEQARKLCLLGATDADIANFFEVDVRTIYNWKLDHAEFLQALKRGKEQADELVEQRLFARATGYSQDAVKIFQYEGKPVEVEYVEHFPPDVTAAIFWLKNRRPEQWRDRHEHNVNHGLQASLTEFLNTLDGQSAGIPVKA